MDLDKPVKILFAEDNHDDLELATRELTQNGIEHIALNVISPEKFIEALHNFKPDVIISDLRMPFFDGIQTLQFSLLHNPDIPFIMLTGATDEETAVACMKAGAFDYIIKDRLNMLPFSVKEAIQRIKLMDDKKKVETFLIEEEKKYRLLFETMNQGIIYYSPKTEIISVNPAAERILGYDAERLYKVRLTDVKWKTITENGEAFPVDQHPAVLAYKGKRKINNVIMGLIKPNRTEVIWLDVSAVPQFDDSSNFPYQVYTTFEDITEKMKTQNELKQSEEKFRLLFEEMNNGMALFEVVFNEDNRPIDCRYINVNSTFAKLMDVERDNVINNTLCEINPDFDLVLLHKYFNVALKGEPVHFEYFDKQLHKYFEIRIYSPIKNQFAVIYQDITDKKHAEKEVEEKTKEINMFFSNSIDLLCIATMDGVFKRINQEWEKTLHYNMSEFEGKNVLDFVHPEDVIETSAVFNALKTNPYYESFLNRLRCKDGTYRFIEWKFYTLNNLIFSAARDITQRIQDEEEIKRKNDELIKSNIEKDKFFSIIAHDLKSPFNGLLGLSEMLADEVDQFSIEDIQKVAKSMKTSATYLFKLLENLLEWSRMQRGVMKNVPETCQLTAFFEQALLLNSSLISNKELVIRNLIPVDFQVSADTHMLNSVLRNLISNAIKFTKSKGTIVINAIKITDKLTHISIKDTGIGISEDEMSTLFKIDSISSSPGTDGETGTGLGLVLCKEYIERNGGKIWIDSELGKGTTVNFTLKTV